METSTGIILTNKKDEQLNDMTNSNSSEIPNSSNNKK